MPLHPYVVHFAVALLLVSVLLFLAGKLGAAQPWSAGVLAAARWNLWIGSVCALASIGTGFFDFLDAQCDTAAVDATILHRRAGAVTWWSSLFAAVAAYRTRQRAPGPLLTGWLLIVAVATITVTTLGTGLTYTRALGVGAAWPADTPRCFDLERTPGAIPPP